MGKKVQWGLEMLHEAKTSKSISARCFNTMVDKLVNVGGPAELDLIIHGIFTATSLRV